MSPLPRSPRRAGRPPGAAVQGRDLAILDHAEALFLAHGYQQVSIEQIARAAGVATRTLYTRFGGKQALFAALVARECTREQAELGALNVSADSAPALRHSLLMMAQHLLSRLLSGKARLLFADALATRDFGLATSLQRIRYGKWRDMLEALFAEPGWHALSRLPASPSATTDLFFGILMSEYFAAMHAQAARQLTAGELDAMAAVALQRFLDTATEGRGINTIPAPE